MLKREIIIEDATPTSVSRFGDYIGVDPGGPVFAAWPGATVFGPCPIDIGAGGELLHVRLEAGTFPARVALLERHFRHTQTYLSANGRPFVMVLGAESKDGFPDIAQLSAFLFRDGAGIAMKAGVWHEFPVALEDDTRFTVILRAESHINELTTPDHPADARGPDLERFDMLARSEIFLRFQTA